MEKTEIQLYKEEINKQVSDPAIFGNLMQITFKGLTPILAKQAMLEAMMVGFNFKDFLQKNVYAIPFGKDYSLVSSIDYSRKIGMRSGVVGVSAPIYTDDEKGAPLTCEITVNKKVGDFIGNFTALVYFREYNTGRNQWSSKPRTMIAKVAEMHALRKACPEELSQMYVEEEYEKDTVKVIENKERNEEQIKLWNGKIKECTDLESLKNIWANVPGELKSEKELIELKEDLKNILSQEQEEIIK